ncbi:hypothetical protein FQA47_023822 [Oryzias melastigma]|uniref:Uncharacterized protein n=1 Tax=Oryzias melastigma TaxID=30732 RepID=A0A834CRB1_ORYME|nr:hypothetical protein FQA47_023822 [Oryzias melastigma]
MKPTVSECYREGNANDPAAGMLDNEEFLFEGPGPRELTQNPLQKIWMPHKNGHIAHRRGKTGATEMRQKDGDGGQTRASPWPVKPSPVCLGETVRSGLPLQPGSIASFSRSLFTVMHGDGRSSPGADRLLWSVCG